MKAKTVYFIGSRLISPTKAKFGGIVELLRAKGTKRRQGKAPGERHELWQVLTTGTRRRHQGNGGACGVELPQQRAKEGEGRALRSRGSGHRGKKIRRALRQLSGSQRPEPPNLHSSEGQKQGKREFFARFGLSNLSFSRPILS